MPQVIYNKTNWEKSSFSLTWYRCWYKCTTSSSKNDVLMFVIIAGDSLGQTMQCSFHYVKWFSKCFMLFLTLSTCLKLLDTRCFCNVSWQLKWLRLFISVFSVPSYKRQISILRFIALRGVRTHKKVIHLTHRSNYIYKDQYHEVNFYYNWKTNKYWKNNVKTQH